MRCNYALLKLVIIYFHFWFFFFALWILKKGVKVACPNDHQWWWYTWTSKWPSNAFLTIFYTLPGVQFKCKWIRKKCWQIILQAYNYPSISSSQDASRMIMHNFKICQNFPTLKSHLIIPAKVSLMMLLIINYNWMTMTIENRRENFASIIVKCIELIDEKMHGGVVSVGCVQKYF